MGHQNRVKLNGVRVMTVRHLPYLAANQSAFSGVVARARGEDRTDRALAACLTVEPWSAITFRGRPRLTGARRRAVSLASRRQNSSDPRAQPFRVATKIFSLIALLAGDSLIC